MSEKVNTPNPLAMFYQWEKSKPDAVYLRQPVNGEWHSYTWREVGDQARRIANALRSMEVAAGKRVCLLSKNCAHWLIADLAIMMSGGASAPAFTTMTADDVLYILNHSGAKTLIVGETDNWQAVSGVLPGDIKVISLPLVDIPEADHSWDSLLTAFDPLAGNPGRNHDDELTTIYTSGSTGKPKGVMYSFEGAGHVAGNLCETFRMNQDDRLISYLPLAHGFERAVIGWMGMNAGFSIGFNENQATFADDIRTVQPTVFQCIPRLWTKFQESVVANFGGQDTLDGLLSDPDHCDATKAKIKQALGLSEGRLLLTGSAPTPLPLHAWYDALDMPLCEIYGQSEVLSGTSNLPWDRKPGTLGKPTRNTELRITDIGEILIKAKAVMTGYLNEPEKTAEVLKDGWVYTGDKGEIDEDGFLKITGRVKEIFKTAKAKYVAPVSIEGHFVSNPYLEQVCLMGSGLPQTVLVAQLSADGIAADRKLAETTIQEHIKSVNQALESHAKIACAVIADGEWSVANGFVTHTMKIKRSAIEKHYEALAEDAFPKGASTKTPLIVWESSGI